MVFFLKFGWEFRDPLGEALTWHLVFYHLIQRGSVPFSISFYFFKILPQNSNNQRRDKALKPSVNVYHVTNISPSNIILSFRFLHVHSKSQMVEINLTSQLAMTSYYRIQRFLQNFYGPVICNLDTWLADSYNSWATSPLKPKWPQFNVNI